MGAGGSVQSNSENASSPGRRSTKSYPTFEVGLLSIENFTFTEQFPNRFFLRLSHESLDFVNMDNNTPILQFPFQQIVCWGSTVSTFRFHVFNYNVSPINGIEPKDICITLKTTEGRNIEDMTMKTVQLLMVDINKTALSKEEFSTLINNIFDSATNSLTENWFQTVDQTTSGRMLLAKQCMDLMQLVGPLAPFEKMEFACLLHTRILTPESFQLIVNTFEDKAERQNLIHRLGLKRADMELTAECAILPTQLSVSPVRVSESPIRSGKWTPQTKPQSSEGTSTDLNSMRTEYSTRLFEVTADSSLEATEDPPES